MDTKINISNEEYNRRIEFLLEHLDRENLSGAVLFDNYYILYYTGFAYVPTERPIAFVLNSAGDNLLFVPKLEVEHAGAYAVIDRVNHYVEYPYQPHPMHIFKDLLEELAISESVGVDSDGYPWIFGYRGPDLSDLMGLRAIRISGFIEDQMMIKSEAEIALIRESVKWGNLAHTLLQRYTSWIDGDRS